MANEYATLEEATARLMNKVESSGENELLGIIAAASRSIDDYLGVEWGYFTPPETATVKPLLGSGNSTIALPMPLYGSVTIEAVDGVTIPNFTVEGTLLRTLTESGYPNEAIKWYRVYYNVEGFWGYSATPDQIREACLQLVAHFWRGRDKALTGTITDMRQDEQFPERDFPRMTRRMLDNFKFSLAQKPSGGLYI